MNLEGQEQRALDIIDRAFNEYQPSHVFALCSGGNDSLTATHLASRHPNFSGVVHIDTGIKVIDEGYRAEDHVRKICEERDWELLVYRAVENTYEDGSPDPQIYEELVLMGANGKGFPHAGFPGPALHSFIYSRLKERQISRLVREHKQHSKSKIMLVTGVRRHESDRRWRNLDRWGEVDVDGARVWVNAIIDFTAEECSAYMKKYGMKANPVRDLICMSGECLCVAPDTLVDTPDGWKEIATFKPGDQALSLVEGKLIAQEIGLVHCNEPKPMIQIKSAYNLPIVVTRNHPVYARTYRFKTHPYTKVFGEPEYIEAGEIEAKFLESKTKSALSKQRHVIGKPFRTQETPLGLSEAQLRIIGYFAAEGAYGWAKDKYRDYAKGLVFTVSKKSNEMAEDIQRCIEQGIGSRVHRRDWVDDRTGREYITVRSMDKASAEFMQQFVNERYCWEKSFKDSIMTASLEEQRIILDAMWRGDGSEYSVPKRSSNTGEGEAVSAYGSTSKLLALQTQELLLRQGKIYGIHTTSAEKRKEYGSEKPFYHVRRHSPTEDGKARDGFIEDGILWTVIRDTKEVQPQTTWNLTMVGEPNYLTPGGLVHNCGCFAKPGEIEVIETCLPKTGAHLRELEAKAKALGYPWGWGKEPPAWWSKFRNGDTFYPEFTDEDDSNPSILHLCTTCQSKHLEDQALRQEMSIDTPSTTTMTTSEITIPDTVPQFTYQFTAIKGLQAQETFYSAMMPIGILVELLVFDEEELSPELRAQRPLNPARIPEIASYVVENPNNYIFDSITVAFEHAVHFAPFMTDGIGMAGTVFIPMNARLRIINGQHRRAGLKEAIARNPALANETISVLIYPNRPLLTQQQNFSDLNMYGQKVTKSLSILYNTRSESATLMHRVHRGIPLFTRLIEVERTSLARRSTKLFCLNHLYEATALNLFDGKTPMTVDEKVEIAISFWTELIKYMPHWNYVLDGQLAAPAVRQDYLHVQGVFLVAFGRLGRILMSKHPSDWQSKLQGLQAVDWSRSNPEWDGIALFGGKVEDNVLVGATIKKSSRVVSAIVDHLLSKLEVEA